MKIVRVELLPAEDVPVYTVCPGSLALRLVTPGACCPNEQMWWGYLHNIESLVTVEADIELIIEKLEITSAELLVINGGEPLKTLDVSVLKELRTRLSKLKTAIALKIQGCVETSLVEEAAKQVDSVIFEVVYHICREGLERMLENLEVAVKCSKHIEIQVPVFKREDLIIVSSIAHKFSDIPLTVLVFNDELFDSTYKLVDKLRKESIPAFLHGDSSFTTLDVFCKNCGETLVKRRPWGVEKNYQPPQTPSLIKCKCGHIVRLLDVKQHRKRPRLRRRVVLLAPHV